MKKFSKKFLSMLATVSMTLTLFAMPVSVNAAETIVNNETELRNAAKNGGNITLGADIENISTIKIPEGGNVNLNLNGRKITTTTNPNDTSRHYYAIDNYGKLTINDSTNKGIIEARGIENLGNGELIINGGTFISCDSNGGASVWNQANLTINGGLFKTLYVGSSSDVVGIGCLNNSGTALITGGSFIDVNKRTYAIISTGDITITPASGNLVNVSGAHGGLAIDSGVAVVNGGNYSSTDYYGLYVSNDGLGADPVKAAVTVNDGTFNGKSYSVWVGSDYNNPVNSTIEINGGVFKKPLNAQECTREGAIQVKGGVFVGNPTEYVDSAKYNVTKTSDVYNVNPKATGITLDKTTASIETGKTLTLKATLAPAGTLDTVTWSTSKSTVATVKDGVVTAVAPGTATITAKANDKTATTCKVTVYKVEPPKVEDVDTTKPVEEVKPIVKQETANTVVEEAKSVVNDIVEGKSTTQVSETTKTNIKKAIEEGKEIKTEVVVEIVKEEAVKTDAPKVEEKLADSNVKKQIGEAKIAQYLNIEIVLKADNQELGTINEVGKELSFTIAVPENLKAENREFYVVRVHNGVAEILPTTMNADGTITFKTNKFSTYALVYTDNTTTGTATKKPTKTSDNSNTTLYASICGLALVGAALVVLTKKREDLLG